MDLSSLNVSVVYLPPQAIDPLSASQVPIAMALAARPDLAGHNQTAVAAGQPTSASHSTHGAAATGRVDVYA